MLHVEQLESREVPCGATVAGFGGYDTAHCYMGLIETPAAITSVTVEALDDGHWLVSGTAEGAHGIFPVGQSAALALVVDGAFSFVAGSGELDIWAGSWCRTYSEVVHLSL